LFAQCEVGSLVPLGADLASLDVSVPVANDETIDHKFWLTRHSYIVEALHGFPDDPDMDMEWRVSLCYMEELQMVGIELDGKLAIEMPLVVPIIPEETTWELDAAAGSIIISMERARRKMWTIVDNEDQSTADVAPQGSTPSVPPAPPGSGTDRPPHPRPI